MGECSHSPLGPTPRHQRQAWVPKRVRVLEKAEPGSNLGLLGQLPGTTFSTPQVPYL